MSDATIRKLLETQLNTAGPFETAWENVSYRPAAGVPWQRVNLLPAQTENPTFGEPFRRPVGVLQITLFFPMGAGPGPAAARADVVRGIFRRGTVLGSGDVRVRLERDPYNGPAIPLDGAWYALPVSVPYVADVFG